ncbi:MAG: hypothetical protein V3V61_00220 [Gammaproteobacteria bacterium]
MSTLQKLKESIAYRDNKLVELDNIEHTCLSKSSVLILLKEIDESTKVMYQRFAEHTKDINPNFMKNGAPCELITNFIRQQYGATP